MKIQLFVISVVLLAVNVAAEIPPTPPYKIQGEYEIDRWGRHLFSGVSISEDVAKVLKPYQGKSVVANVTTIEKNEFGWASKYLSLDSIALLTNAPKLEMTISAPKSWSTNAPVPIVLAFTNTTDQSVYLWPGWDSTDLFAVGGPTNETPQSSGNSIASFRFRTDVLISKGMRIEDGRETPGSPECARILPGGSFRIQVETKTPLPEGEYQLWWRIAHTCGPEASGYPARSPRVDLDIKQKKEKAQQDESTVSSEGAPSEEP